MRTRLALVLTAAAFAAAVPAHATNPLGGTPYCATALANADAGSTTSCSTVGPPGVACMGCGVRRTVEVVAATGGVDATLTCDGSTYGPLHVDGPGRGELGIWGGRQCQVTLVATADGTNAVVTSTASYTIEVA